MNLKNIFETETLQLNTYNNDFWLYDKVLEMNLSMRAKTEREAFVEALEYYQRTLVEALEYYQRQLAESEDKLRCLTKKVSSFVQLVHDDCEITPEIDERK